MWSSMCLYNIRASPQTLNSKQKHIQSLTCQMVLSGTPYDPITTFSFLQQKVHIGENTPKK